MGLFSKNKKKSYSPECQSMIDRGVGFRTESFSGSRVRDAIDVCIYECVDLGNTDIFETLLKLYGGQSQYWQWIKEWVEDYDEIYWQEVQEALEDVFMHDLPIRVRYALWLAPSDTVIEHYARPGGRIDAYDVSDAIVLSDLGYDGVLFGFEKNPEPIRSYL